MSSDESDLRKCPEWDCHITTSREELAAHLRWDHNRTTQEAVEMLDSEGENENCACCGNPLPGEPRPRTDMNGTQLRFCSRSCEWLQMGVPIHD